MAQLGSTDQEIAGQSLNLPSGFSWGEDAGDLVAVDGNGTIVMRYDFDAGDWKMSNEVIETEPGAQGKVDDHEAKGNPHADSLPVEDKFTDQDAINAVDGEITTAATSVSGLDSSVDGKLDSADYNPETDTHDRYTDAEASAAAPVQSVNGETGAVEVDMSHKNELISDHFEVTSPNSESSWNEVEYSETIQPDDYDLLNIDHFEVGTIFNEPYSVYDENEMDYQEATIRVGGQDMLKQSSGSTGTVSVETTHMADLTEFNDGDSIEFYGYIKYHSHIGDGYVGVYIDWAYNNQTVF